MSANRIERDSMGEMPVPCHALYGASTQRAVLNFPISNRRIDSELIHAYGLIKRAAARANGELGLISHEIGSLIERAALEVSSSSSK